jgi:hypothetical protein
MYRKDKISGRNSFLRSVFYRNTQGTAGFEFKATQAIVMYTDRPESNAPQIFSRSKYISTLFADFESGSRSVIHHESVFICFHHGE